MSSAMPDPTKCQWCAGFHATKCPLVKAIEYHQDGTTKRVEFYAATDYPPTPTKVDQFKNDHRW